MPLLELRRNQHIIIGTIDDDRLMDMASRHYDLYRVMYPDSLTPIGDRLITSIAVSNNVFNVHQGKNPSIIKINEGARCILDPDTPLTPGEVATL
jgi:hypothetical protein